MRWGGLFFKYVTLFVGLVTGVLLINGALDLYFVYQDNRRASIDVQREKAEAAAQRIESFVREIDRSTEPAFIEAMANKVYFGPVYFRKESEPYFTMAVVHGGKGGVTVAEVNLKLIWDVVSNIKIGRTGYAYVVDRLGRLVAHPDISLVLRGTDMNKLAQVAAARTP